MVNIGKILSINLKALRAERKLSQEGLAQIAGVSKQTVQLVETERRWPRKEQIAKLASALRVPETRLFEDPDRVIQDSQPKHPLDAVKKIVDEYYATLKAKS